MSNDAAAPSPGLRLRGALSALGWWLLPGACASCWSVLSAADGDFLCRDCRASIEVVDWPECPCREGPAQLRPRPECVFCKPLPVSFESARAAFPYGGVVGQVIRNMKYRRGEQLAEPLARLALARLGGWIDRLRDEGRIDAIAPAPMHPWRRFRRGFNQAEAIADAIGRFTGTPVDRSAILRVANPRAQVRRANHESRLEAMQGAFACPDRARVEGRGFLLVDDVMTTGATLSSCAEVLRRSGAREVHLLSVAFAGPFARQPAPDEMRGQKPSPS